MSIRIFNRGQRVFHAHDIVDGKEVMTHLKPNVFTTLQDDALAKRLLDGWPKELVSADELNAEAKAATDSLTLKDKELALANKELGDMRLKVAELEAQIAALTPKPTLPGLPSKPTKR